MRTMRPTHDEECAVACTADLIGGKWTAILVHDLSEGPRRFSDLEEEGVLHRESYAESPPRVEYELTAKGRGLLPIIEAMRRFGHDHLVPEHDHSADEGVRAEPVQA
jgi:DNA-binding HxlR family transcriptional regulator